VLLATVGSLGFAQGLFLSPEAIVEVELAVTDSTPENEPANPPRYIFERLPVTDRVLELPTAKTELGFERYEELVPALTPDRVVSLRVRYTLDPELSRRVFRILEARRVALGHVILLDPNTGRVLAYASTDVDQFPPTRTYPAASLVKVITAAAALGQDPKIADLPCRYRGSPYQLTPAGIDPPKTGIEVSLRRALASSNNQCFAQLAVHAVGGDSLVEAISRFGWLSKPAPGHSAGSAERAEDRFDVGMLGCGLAGAHITPLHAAQLAATLTRGELVAPHWIEGVFDADGRELPMPAVPAPRQVIPMELAEELRAMLIDTTVRGTARRAFRQPNGQALLGSIKVAGKTGSLSGTDPTGRYEWFAGVAPANEPRIAIAVLLVQNNLWWRNASQIAAEVLQDVFCEGRDCRPDLVARWMSTPTTTASKPPMDRLTIN
jgi:cell division protein FtsI/penicillin-binding protein 2